MANERNATKYIARYLGCKVENRVDKDTKEKTAETYGIIALAYCGIREVDETAWYSVQNLYTSEERMHEICDGIPFDSKVEVEFLTGTTPGGKQRISKMTVIE